MKNLKLQYSLALVAGLFSFDGHSQIQFDLMHTDPSCSYNGFQKTFCHGQNDTKAADLRSGMVDKINAQLDRTLKNPSQAKVYIAYFSMSNKNVHKKICQILSKGVAVEIVLDRGSIANVSALQENPACAGVDTSSPSSKLKVAYLGGLTSQPWRLHHNKFLFVDPGVGQSVNVNFSSGNLSAFGTSLHLDHWVTMVAPKTSNLVKSYECVIEGLRAAISFANSAGGHQASNDSQVAQRYIQSREACFGHKNVMGSSQIEQAIAREGIASMFAPNNDDIVHRTFVNEISRVPANGYIYIAIQHFLHRGIGQALVNASRKGVDVRIIMDDDVVTNKGEVQGAQSFLEGLKSQAPRIMVRYIETNRNAGGNGSMMHNKFALLNGNRVLSGAGQYTGAAMRNNWENFGLTQVPILNQKYAKYFKSLWNVSVDENYVRAQLPYNEDINASHAQPSIATPAVLNANFLNLAK